MLHVRVSQVISAGDGCATCIARGNIRCDVDENLWPNQQDRQDVHEDENLSCDVDCCEEVQRFVWFCFCFTKLSQVFSLLWMLIVFAFFDVILWQIFCSLSMTLHERSKMNFQFTLHVTISTQINLLDTHKWAYSFFCILTQYTVKVY